MRGSLIVAGVIGFLIGLIYCYSKQLNELAENKDLLASGGKVYTSLQDFYGQIREKF